jgi:hypothetical protein
MKASVLLLLPLLIFTACASTQVGPKPDVSPVRTSNKATRTSIKKAQTSIHEAQVKAAEGDTALEKAHNYLNQLLNEK